MKMNLLKGKNHITEWLLSYLVIILCLFTAMGIIVGVYFGSLKKEMNEFNEFVFESVSVSVNDVLLDVNDLHLSLARNQNMEKVLSYSGNRLQMKETYALIEDIKAYRQFSSNIDRFFIYLKDEDMVISESGITDSYSYYNLCFKDGKLSYEDWKKIFYEFENDRYISLFANNNTGKMVDSLGFMFRLPIYNPRAVGMILCDKQYFMKNIEKIEWKNLCDIYIYNGEGNLILQSKNSDGGEIPETLKEIEAYEKENNTVLRKTIAIDKYYWQLVIVVSKYALNKSIYLVQGVTVAVVMLSLILLVFLVRYLLKINRKPLQRVLSLFGVTDEKDEYNALHKYISQTLDDKSELMKNIKVRDRELKTVAISKIIKGNLPSSALLEYNIEFRSENYAVISFYLEDLSTLFREDSVMPNFERNYHLRYIINNVMEELLQEKGIHIYTTEIDSYVVCLANLEDNVPESTLSEMVQKGVSYINRYFDIKLDFAVSDVYKAFSQLCVAYAQTVELLEYKRITKTDSNISFSQMQKETDGQYAFDMGAEEKLIHFIKINSIPEATAIVSLVFKRLKSTSNEYARYVALDIAGTITKCAEDYIYAQNGGREREIKLYNAINAAIEITKMEEELKSYINEVCTVSTFVTKKKKRQKCTAEEIRDYVHKNLTDFNLTAVSIGLYFDLTAAYVSKIFKDSEKESLTDYIAKKRIEKAQEIMASGKFPMREIAEMVGFSNERTYYRALKKFNQK